MLEYPYSQLSLPTSIRLLRLLPSERDSENLRGELFEYDLQKSNKPISPYEALSYVWGSEDRPQAILIDNYGLNVTHNLYTALLRLRDHSIPRIIWVDAICINQQKDQEKEHQISLMTEIYSKASRVIIWLGEAQDNSSEVLDALLLAGEEFAESSDADKEYSQPSITDIFHQGILHLLEREWFQRIWVLQEVAAARDVLIICGLAEIDGYAFSSGLASLGEALLGSLPQVTFLIRKAIFRPRRTSRKKGIFSLGICSLGELLDMYHLHQATKPHDKIYALLGMCSDEFQGSGLEPDYSVPWGALIKSLIKFLLGDQAFVATCDDDKLAVINIKGCVVGKVSSVERNIDIGGGWNVEAVFKDLSNKSRRIRDGNARWALPNSARCIQKGDLICLLQGASKPTIIRLRENHFDIIAIAAVPPKHIRTQNRNIEWSELSSSASFIRDFLLTWDWKIPSDTFQDRGEYDILTQTCNWKSECSEKGLEGQLDNATRTWNVALILGDWGDWEDIKSAEERIRGAIQGYELALDGYLSYPLKSYHDLTPLSWAAENGYDAVVNLLLTKSYVDVNLKDSKHGRTPLLLAAGKGHDAVVEQLLATGKANVDLVDKDNRTPLSWAAEKGHDAVVKLLLKGKADIELKCGSHVWACEDEYEDVAWWSVESKFNVEPQDTQPPDGSTPLSLAAANGHVAVVKLLLESKADINSKNTFGQTPLWLAAEKGQEDVIKLLIEAGKVDLNSMDDKGDTPLLISAFYGHDTVVKLLLENMADVNIMNDRGWTPLMKAAEHGHLTVVKQLLVTDDIIIDPKSSPIRDKYRTPLSYAAENGHEAVVKLLLEHRADPNLKDEYGRTSLSWAAKNGHSGVVKQLLATDNININLRSIEDAAVNGHEAVVKLLLAIRTDIPWSSVAFMCSREWA